ncbi:MAG: hypothetical protein K8T89_02220 [Planctomycetes bacterium]|nr:hypothetical protein [Planctomycetota bacterium]
MMNPFPTRAQLVAKAREAIRKDPPKMAHDLYMELVSKGFIHSKWEVTKLIGGSADPEPNYKT